MKLRPGFGLAAAVTAQTAAFYGVLLHWPAWRGLLSFLLLLFLFTPLMFVYCLDVVRSLKASAPSPANILGRVVFSLPVLVLALLAILVGVAFAVAFGFMLFSQHALQVVLSLPQVIAILLLFFLFGFGLLRLLVSRHHDHPLP